MNHDQNHNTHNHTEAENAGQDFYNSLKTNTQTEHGDHGHDNHTTHDNITAHHTAHETSAHSHHSGHTDHSEETDDSEEGSGSKIVKIIVVLGILILLFFISIGIVRFVPKAIGSLSGASVYLSNLFSNDGVSLSFKEDTVESNKTLTVETKNTSKEEGDLAWNFTCTEGISILYRSVDGKDMPVICETWFPLKEATYTFTVISKNEDTTNVASTLSLFAKADGNIIASDSKAFSVKGVAENKPQTNTTLTENKETPDYTPATNTESKTTTQTNTQDSTKTSSGVNNSSKETIAVVGATDLSITLIQANAIRPGSLTVQNLSNVSPTDKVYIRFKIANNGVNKSDSWKLSTELPTLTQSDRFFTSKYQPSLAPGQSAEMTMMFDNFDSTKNSIKLVLDNPRETNSSNNTLIIPISGNRSDNVSTSGTRADLITTITDIGIIDGYNNFISTSNIDTGDRVAVKFEVANIGTENSGYYDIKINFPTDDEDTRYFESRSPLRAGSKSYFTVVFENPEEGRQDIEIEVDSGNDVRENSESNNDTSRSIRIND